MMLLVILLVAAARAQPPASTAASETAASDTKSEAAIQTPLEIVALRIEPESPAAETLCHLRAVIANRGERPASGLRFAVSLEGTALAVYDKQVFVETLVPGAETTVELFNFWTSEDGRPLPADGVLDVVVSLEAARWLTRDMAEDGTELLSLEGAVPGLPVRRGHALEIAGVAKPPAPGS